MKRFLISILTAFTVNHATHAEAMVSLHLYTESFPPYNFVEKNTIKGINAEIVKEACANANVRCASTLLPWRRAMSAALSSANAGLFTTSLTPEREDMFQWVGPLVSGSACLYKLNDRADINVENPQALLNYTVGIARSDVYESVLLHMGLKEGEQFLTYSNKHDDTRMFKQRKLDLLIGSSVTLELQLSEVGLSPEDVTPVYKFNDDVLKGNYLALNNSVDKEIVSTLQEAIDRMKARGRFDTIIARYITPISSSNRTDVVNFPACLDGTTDY